MALSRVRGAGIKYTGCISIASTINLNSSMELFAVTEKEAPLNNDE